WAAAQNAANAAPVFPLDVARQTLISRSTKRDTASAAKRSLYEPVGLRFSSLKYKLSRPRVGPIWRDFTKGVCPSPRVIRARWSTSGSHSRYVHIPFKTRWEIEVSYSYSY